MIPGKISCRIIKVGILNSIKAFLKRKDVVISKQRYFLEAMSAMTLGLFSSLIIGLILKTLGSQLGIYAGESRLTEFLVQAGTKAGEMMGAAIGVSVAWGLHAPPMVIFASTVTGAMGAVLGGPAGAFIAAVLGAEAGKLISKETKLDIILTPALTIIAGTFASATIGPFVAKFMHWLGFITEKSTELQPFLMGIIVSTIVGLVLTAPISSAALAIMMGLSGLAGGAATVGCSAQMIGFAVISIRENKIGGFFAQGIGTSMLQVPNIIKNPWILLPPTLAGAILGPVSTVVFKMTNIPEGSGMGTSGLVGQIGTLTSMGISADVIFKIILLHFILPAVLALVFDYFLRKSGKIKGEDYLLNL